MTTIDGRKFDASLVGRRLLIDARRIDDFTTPRPAVIRYRWRRARRLVFIDCGNQATTRKLRLAAR